MSDLLIYRPRILQMADETAYILENHDIIVRGNHIEAIWPTGKADPSQFATVIRADGLLAMPGLINTHAHVPMVLWRGLGEDVSIERWFNDYIWPLERNLTPEDVYWGMLLGIAEMIEAGVTAVADHYWYMDEAAKAVEQAGTRALLGQAMFSSNGMQQIEETARFAQRWDGAAEGRIRTILAPHAPYTCDDDFLSATARQAQKMGLGVHIHVAETMGQTQASLEKRGITPIKVLEETGILDVPAILAHAIGATPADIEILMGRQTGVAHCPKTYLKLAMGYAPIIEFRTAGIPVGLGTDGAVSNNTLDIWESMRLLAMTQKERTHTPENLTIPQALWIATRESAIVYGQGDALGDLSAGKLADIILINMDGVHHQPLHSVTTSLVYNMRPSDVQTVIINGKVVMQDRRLLTIDKSAVLDYVQRQLPRLTRRDTNQRIQTYNP